MSHLTVSPAYGRDYKSGKAARADWDANKDFIIQSIAFGGSYVNKGQSQELLDAGISEVMIRFKRLENFVLVKLDRGQCGHVGNYGDRCEKKKGHAGAHHSTSHQHPGGRQTYPGAVCNCGEEADCLNPLCTKKRGHSGACAG